MAISEKIKALLGADYTEGMTEAEALEKLDGKNIVDLAKGEYTSSNKYNDELRKRKDAEEKATNAEKALNEIKDAQLSAEERAQKQLAEAMKAKDELNATLEAELNKAKVEKIFAGAGLADEQIDTLSSSVTPDTAKEIVELMKANSEAAVKKAKEEALKDFKSPDGGKPAPEKSFSEMTLDELTELKRTDPARYEMLKNSKK